MEKNFTGTKECVNCKHYFSPTICEDCNFSSKYETDILATLNPFNSIKTDDIKWLLDFQKRAIDLKTAKDIELDEAIDCRDEMIDSVETRNSNYYTQYSSIINTIDKLRIETSILAELFK